MWWRILVACLLFLFTCVYRFNTMGGRYGGFDNDHFVSFAYAKQVQAGERPLRDFEGLGLQGAWPSLTYIVPAVAQAWLGNNLRSEALVTIFGVALAVALTLVAASLLSGIGWAIPATVVSIFVAPTLYNYPKVLVLAASALLIASYVRRPSAAAVAGGAALTAVSFLFRHDYAAYVGVGMLVACFAVGDWHRAVRHCVLYLAITLALLTPSLAYVHHYADLSQYFRDGLELSRREALRTRLRGWPVFALSSGSGDASSFAAFFQVEQNSVAWLYYLARLLPLMVVLVFWKGDSEADRRQVRAAALAIAGMFAFCAPLLIRGNVAVRLGDVGPLLSILLAVVCHRASRHRAGVRRRLQIAGTLAAILLLACTALSAQTVGVITSQLRTSGLSESWKAAHLRTAEIWNQLGALPDPAAISKPDGTLVVARYLNRCTAASDRVVLLTYEPELLPFAGRLFGAGRLSVIPGYVLGERHQRQVVARWSQQSVPLVLVEFEEFFDMTSQAAPLVRDYLLAHYTHGGAINLDQRVLHVFVRRDLRVVSTFGSLQLPCLREAIS